MKSTTKLQVSVLSISVVIAAAVFALAPSIIWTSDSDWNGGTHGNITIISEYLRV